MKFCQKQNRMDVVSSSIDHGASPIQMVRSANYAICLSYSLQHIVIIFTMVRLGRSSKFPRFSEFESLKNTVLSEQCRDGEGGRQDCPLVPSEGRA